MMVRLFLLILFQFVVSLSFAADKVKLDKYIFNKFYTYKQDSLVGLTDSEGNKILDPIYQKIEYFSDSFGVAMKYHKWDTDKLSKKRRHLLVAGLVNLKTGKLSTPVMFYEISIHDDGSFFMRDTIGGSYIFNPYKNEFSFSYAPFHITFEDGRYHLRDSLNQHVVGPFHRIYPFNQKTGWGLLRQDTLFYRFHKSGKLEEEKLLSNCFYDFLLDADSSCFMGGPFVEFLDGDISSEFLKGGLLFEKDGKGLLDSSYKVGIPAIYNELEFYDDDVYMAKKDNLYGLITKSNKTLFPFVSDKPKSYKKGFFVVYNKDHRCALFSHDKMILPFEYDYIGSIRCTDMFVVWKNQKCGIIDSKGKCVQPLSYDDITCDYNYSYGCESDNSIRFDEHNGVWRDDLIETVYRAVSVSSIRARLDTRHYLISLDGRKRKRSEFPFYRESIFKSAGKFGLKEADSVSHYSHIIFPAVYDSIFDMDLGFYKVEKEGKFGVVSSNSKCLIPVSYKNVDDKFIVTDNRGKKGAFSPQGKCIVPVKYNSIEYKYENHKVSYLIVTDSLGNKGIYSTQGKCIVPVKYENIDYEYNDSLHCGFFVTYRSVDSLVYKGVVSDGGKVVMPEKTWHFMLDSNPNCIWVVDIKTELQGVYSYSGKCIIPINFYDVDYDDTDHCFVVKPTEDAPIVKYSINGKHLW